MNTPVDEYFVESYAFGKLCEFVDTIFTGIEPARTKLSENLHFIAIISPSDFRQETHQREWENLQKRLLCKTKNIGSETAPVERLTVRNETLTSHLESI